MSQRARRHDEILGASVLLTGWSEEREDEVAEALASLSTERIDLDRVELPIVALAKASLEKAEAVRELLVAAGGSVALEDAWVTRKNLERSHRGRRVPSAARRRRSRTPTPDPPPGPR